MKLKKLIDECYDALTEDIKEAVRCDIERANATVNTDDGYIDLYCDRKGDIGALVFHDDEEREHNSDNLEKHLIDNLKGMVDWDSIEEEVMEDESYDNEWNDHGFRDAADFWHWKEGL